jgi:hypothetical protein
MDTARAFIALLTSGAWGRLPAEGRAESLELVHELDNEDCDRFALLVTVRGEHFHCFERAQR